MSGAGAFGYSWATLALGGFFALVGLMSLLPRRYVTAVEPAWLIEARLLHPEAAPDGPAVPPSRNLDYLTGAMMLLLALLQFTSRDPVGIGRVFLLVAGSFLLACGLFVLAGQLLPTPPEGSWGERRRKRKLERRLARGSDAYADELRNLLKPALPAQTPGRQRAGFVFLTLAGAGLLAAGLATPR